MLKVIRKFFAFCGEENRRKFITSIRLNVIQALFEALKIPAIAVMIRALMNGRDKRYPALVRDYADQHCRIGIAKIKGCYVADRRGL